jgi:hypothetical protein
MDVLATAMAEALEVVARDQTYYDANMEATLHVEKAWWDAM